ncbi:hypothetical protein HMPREF9690_05308, partial [Raoultella ornithinolytica 10-5246]
MNALLFFWVFLISIGMVLANRCHRQNMKTSIINGSEVSRLSVAIQ